MAVYRDHPPTGTALVAQVVHLTSLAIAAGCGAAFVVTLVLAIIGEEAFGSTYAPFDPVTRAAIGIVSVVAIAALGVAAFGYGAARSAYTRQLARQAEERPDEIATWSDRRAIETASPFGIVYVYTWWIVGLGALAILIVSLALGETWRYNPESAAEGTGVLVGLIAGVLVIGGLGLLTRLVAWPRWQRDAGRVRLVWRDRERAAATQSERSGQLGQEKADFGLGVRALHRAARALSRIAPVAAVVGFVVFFAAVYARQPCRNCDQRFFDRPIESAIDVLAVASAPILLAALVLGLVAAASEWIATISERATLRRLADQGARAPRPAQLLPVLTRRGPAESLGLGLAGVGGGAGAFALGALLVVDGPGPREALAVSGAVVLVGALLISVSIPATGRLRNHLRAAWRPGDPVPPKPDARRRTAPMRDAGDVARRGAVSRRNRA